VAVDTQASAQLSNLSISVISVHILEGLEDFWRLDWFSDVWKTVIVWLTSAQLSTLANL
jgi:hypothetical protein